MRSTNTGMEAEEEEVLSSEARSRGGQRLGVQTSARSGTGLVFHDKWVIHYSLVSFDSGSQDYRCLQPICDA